MSRATATQDQSRGTLVVVVGPSGAGKDTLIGRSMEQFAGREDVHLVRRVITRPEDAGGEDHRGVTAEEFAAMRATGAFAVDWDAHGLSYGIPACVHEKLALGHLVIANGSRSALPLFASAFDPLLVINIFAQPDVLARRLELRGRESREDILARLARGSLQVDGPFNVISIDNSGEVDEAARMLIDILEPLIGCN
ncbi:phosphonate metabolism protein/1,5-bisphosphokinase (PRPP-forming) PhnN [Ciceribacter sp. L1K23]|uniref:phosphonate metabolism protein/1,5-bisphosphokinase (PRPP-forming) PhnN n=1 Tax=Ciceribacter sp. L1K23 TaxID=2820276 RepID=UPI001B813DFB|nr:phosphonate metabolism protein/1,5-bisphosphokinase (PRPP-forming) PhnN [Ciceribacter sp. L1K23]MBR0557568.1 phosphonate metabolism protein/1,5-bisphosphokinase (PRPP-forming) PhnN [Ciceribacter sp. L1K23]